MSQLAKQILSFLKSESQNENYLFDPLDLLISQNASLEAISNALNELEYYGFIHFKNDIIGSFYFTP